MLEIHEVVVTPFEQNCTILVCPATGEAAICDGGDAAPVLARVAELGVRVTKILATHGHLDHIGGTAELQQALRVPFYFPSGDDFWRLALPEQAARFGFPEVEIPQPDHDLQQGDEIVIGQQKLDVLHCPGHTPGHVVFHDSAGQQLIAGDVLFRGSVGRTDFPRGSFRDLERSIRSRLYSLPAATCVHCGHGPQTTIGHEARTNPFVRL
jgi:glyoxylase-like metal-dependent hydrolase (beta-lactamase superfamily II)